MINFHYEHDVITACTMILENALLSEQLHDDTPIDGAAELLDDAERTVRNWLIDDAMRQALLGLIDRTRLVAERLA